MWQESEKKAEKSENDRQENTVQSHLVENVFSELWSTHVIGE